MPDPFHKNPSGDIYRIMDEAGLTQTNLQNPAKAQKDSINKVRLDLAEKFKSYIKWRDEQVAKQTLIALDDAKEDEIKI